MEKPNKKLYLSGRISGLSPKEAGRWFAQAAREVEAMGYEAVNPLRNGLDAAASWAEHLGRDITLLLGCSGIYLLEGWRESLGARIEAAVAAEAGLVILHQPEYGDYESKL